MPGSASELMQDDPSAALVFNPDREGAYSTDKVLERLTAARAQASKESNRFLLTSLLFVIFYIIKLAGLRADLILFDQKIFEVPYGLFAFLVASHIAFCLSAIRASDARAYDRLVNSICGKMWPGEAEFARNTFPNDQQWFDPTSYAVRLIKKGSLARFLFSFFTAITVLVILLIYLSPLLSGLYYLFYWKQQIVSGDVDLQYYVALATTSLAIVWFVNYIIVYALTERLSLR